MGETVAQQNDRDVIAVLGGNGQGKTRWLQAHVKGWTRAIIIEGGFKDEEEFPGVKVETLEDFEDYMSAVGPLRPFRVRFTPTQEEFWIICDWAKAAGSLTLLVEEAHRYIKKWMPLDAGFLDLINMGRHYGELGEGVSLVVVSTAPADFPIEFRRQITRAVVFSTTEPSDIKWLGDFMGSEWAEKAARLPPGRFIEWERGVGCKEVVLWES